MQTLPTRMLYLLNPFAPLFSERVWSHAQVLLAGAILAGHALGASARMTCTASIVRQTAWYRKARPTFSDALALVRRESWTHETFRWSSLKADTIKVPRVLVEPLTEVVCYAA